MYRVDGDNLHTNFIKFMDLSGSERFEKAGIDSNAKNTIEWMEGVGSNWSLYVMARVIGNVARLKKPLTGGEVIPNNTSYKEIDITRVMKHNWNGTAFTVFMFCLSMAERNGGESFSTIKFAEECSKLRANVTRPSPKSVAILIKNFQK